MEAIEKRITSDLVDKQPDLEITSIDTDYEVEVKNDGDGETIETTATTTANITKTTGDTSTGTTGTTGTTSSDTSTEGGEDEGGEDEGGEDGGEDKSISAVRGVDDDPQPQLNTSMAEKYPKNPLAKYSGYFKTIKII